VVGPSLLALLVELSPSSSTLSSAVVAERVGREGVHVVVAERADQVVGMATLSTCTTLANGLLGHVEDVVAESFRGHQVGGFLMRGLHEEAIRLGLRQLELTSRPSREAANRLYRSLGYEQREANVYRLLLVNVSESLSSS
jgi:ribosomal protein S18 acetylase RimI-like enzyme